MITDAIPINWQLVANPINWVTVALMLLIFGFAIHILLPSLTNA